VIVNALRGYKIAFIPDAVYTALSGDRLARLPLGRPLEAANALALRHHGRGGILLQRRKPRRRGSDPVRIFMT